MVKATTRTGMQPIQPLQPRGREAELRQKGREFQATLRREYLQEHKPERANGKVAVGFDEHVIVSGMRAQEGLRHLENVVRLSPTFRRVLDKAIAEKDTVWIVIGRGGGNSRSTIGAGDEKVYVNLDQGDLLDLIIHECGHALAKLKDGPLGGFGPNQRFQAVVKREMEMGAGGEKAYGTEVRGNPPPTRGRTS